jgi:KipI family sensor histidine kinase inhibitor
MTNPSFLNESCLQWSFGDSLDEATVRATLSAFGALRGSPVLEDLGVTDLVPAYNKLAVHFCGSESRHRDITAAVDELLCRAVDEPGEPGKLHRLAVRYSGDDLARVAAHCGLCAGEVIARHAAPDYLVAMIGFQPHFPYLFGLDASLETPRLETPRLSVPAGAVAIGGAQTGVYPSATPGGWNLIGRTDPAPLRALRPGDRVRFIAEEPAS